MFESADRGDLRRMGLLDETPFQTICTHCGSDSRVKNYGWLPKGKPPVFGCCEKRLVENHGAQSSEVVAQSHKPLWC